MYIFLQNSNVCVSVSRSQNAFSNSIFSYLQNYGGINCSLNEYTQTLRRLQTD